MGRPLRIEYPGAFYHVTARGNERRAIFKCRADRERFLDYLVSATERYGAVIHVWCLMGNHYHLLMETPVGNLSQIMRHINGAYTNYFNVSHKRSGHLFQGRYKAILVERDAYALELSRYIHLNPVRAKMSPRPEDYVWSSYRNYVGQQKAPNWLRRVEIMAHFDGDESRYLKFVEDGIVQDVVSPLLEMRVSSILGRDEFVQKIEDTVLSGRDPSRDVPDLRKFHSRWSMDEILEIVTLNLGSDANLARKVAIHLCHRHSGEKLREIGERFGIGESAVSQESRRLLRKIGEDEGLRERVENIHRRLRNVNV